MDRFYTTPSNAQDKFAYYAYRIHPLNMKGAFMRGCIRLS